MDFYKIKYQLEKQLEKDPLNKKIITEYACVLMETGDFEKALIILKKAAANNPSFQILNNLAYFYFHEGDVCDGIWVESKDKAIEILKQVIILNPPSHFPYSLLGEIYLSKSIYDEAEDALKKAINIKETVENNNNLGVALFKKKRYQTASEYFFKAHSLKNDIDYSYQPYLSYGICLSMTGRKKEAEWVVEFLLNSGELNLRDNDNLGIDLLDIAKMYFYNENYVKAAEFFPLAIEKYYVSSYEFCMYEYTLVLLNMLEEADSFYNKTISYNRELIEDISEDTDMGEHNKNETVKSLKFDAEQYEKLYHQIKNGYKPSFMFEPQIEEACYLFGCIRHNNL